MKFAILREIVREAAYGLYHHRFRAALSMLGISWGIISVVVLLAYGDGFRAALDAGIKGAYSEGTVIVFPGQTSLQAGGERAGKRSIYLYRASNPKGDAWTREVLDDGGMAGAGCAIADMNADKKMDVVCIGTATANLKVYENAGK